MRRHAEFGGRRHGRTGIDIGEAKPLRPNQALIGDHAHDDARQVAIRHLGPHPRFKNTLGPKHVGAGLRRQKDRREQQHNESPHGVQCIKSRGASSAQPNIPTPASTAPESSKWMTQELTTRLQSMPNTHKEGNGPNDSQAWKLLRYSQSDFVGTLSEVQQMIVPSDKVVRTRSTSQV